MPYANCPEYIRLQSEASSVLKRLAELTQSQLEAFQEDNHELFMHLDKELELTVGHKERTIGALRQHISEHRCLVEKA